MTVEFIELFTPEGVLNNLSITVKPGLLYEDKIKDITMARNEHG